MKKPEDNPADPFKKALAEATRTIANDSEMGVTYTVDPSGISNDGLRLPQISRRMTRDEVMLARGTADSFALRRRFHDAPTHNRYAPQGDMAREIFEAMEHARCEAMGARAMPGTAKNIDTKIEAEAARKGYKSLVAKEEAPLSVAAGYLVRQMATGRDLPEGADNVARLWREHFEQQAGTTLEELQEALSDQTRFSRMARQVIDDLGFGDQLGDDPDGGDDDDQGDDAEAEPEDQDQPDESGGDQDDEGDDQDAAPDQSQETQQDEQQA